MRTSEVIVLGGGVIGCAVAYELACRGARVQVIDRREVGLGATQAAAGVLAPYLESHQGSPLVELGAQSLALYDEFVARVVEDSGSAVQYTRSGSLEVAMNDAAFSRLKELGQIWRDSRVAVEVLDASSVRALEPQLASQILGGLLVETHGVVGAADLTSALQRAAGAHGVTFVPSTMVKRVTREGDGLGVQTATDKFSCDKVVLAAGSWSGQIEIEGADTMPVHPVRGQLLHLGWPATRLNHVVWAANCYLVPWTDGSVLAGATVEDVGFDERATVKGLQQLLEVAREIAPAAGDAWFKAIRVGLRPSTPDHLPVIGPSTCLKGLVYATGHYRNGILLAPLTASLVADLVLEEKNTSILDAVVPSRFGKH